MLVETSVNWLVGPTVIVCWDGCSLSMDEGETDVTVSMGCVTLELVLLK